MEDAMTIRISQPMILAIVMVTAVLAFVLAVGVVDALAADGMCGNSSRRCW